MGAELGVGTRSDGLCDGCADIRDLELPFKQTEHPVRGYQAAHTGNGLKGERLFQ